jgi:hypothetical protein
MSELGFWVPAHESRDSHDADHRESQAAQLEKFAAWDPSKHPRGGNPKNTGQFSKVPGASLVTSEIAYGADSGNQPARGPKPPTEGRLAGSVAIEDAKSGLKGTLSVFVDSKLNRDTGVYITYKGNNVPGMRFFQFTRGELNLTVFNPIRGKARYRKYSLDGMEKVEGGNSVSYGKNSQWDLDHVPGRFVYYSDNPFGAGRTANESWIFDAPTFGRGRLKAENGRLNDIAGSKEAWATFTDHFRTYVEFNGKIVGRVDWEAYTTWDSGKLWNKISDTSYRVTYIGTNPGKRADVDTKVLIHKGIRTLQNPAPDRPGEVFERLR